MSFKINTLEYSIKTDNSDILFELLRVDDRVFCFTDVQDDIDSYRLVEQNKPHSFRFLHIFNINKKELESIKVFLEEMKLKYEF
jgi:hypothetical protein